LYPRSKTADNLLNVSMEPNSPVESRLLNSEPIEETNFQCWCGNADLAIFSSGYFCCPDCSTLIARDFPVGELSNVSNDEEAFYGKEYWLSHQTNVLGLTSIEQRSRTDLLDRCGHWLKTVLKFHLPPGDLLDVGCSHGAFVALSALAGFRSVGLELSPWVVEYAQETFKVPIREGPIEAQGFPTASYDVITLFDVLEHLQDPRRTIQECARILSPTGMLVIQTPCFPAGTTYGELQKKEDPFLKMLLPDEHLFLFSERSVSHLLQELGFRCLQFEKAPFAHYDMLVVASRTGLNTVADNERWEVLRQSTTGRLLEAYMVQDARNRDLYEKLVVALNDAGARLENINKLEALLKESEPARLALFKQLDATQSQLDATQSQLNATQSQLNATQSQLNATQSQLAVKSNQLDVAQRQLDVLQSVFRWVPKPIRKKIVEILARKGNK
jgi:2-polyprenyl-3-methyl-5-hydroxy-6-metoxy-1,4-benzoquinol methylase